MRGNVFSGGTIDRAAALRRDARGMAERLGHPDSRFVPMFNNQSLVRPVEQGYEAVALAGGVPAAETVFLGLQNGQAYFAVDVETDTLGEFADLRQIGSLLSPQDAALLAYARAMLQWHRNHRFCGRCGAPTISEQGGHLRRCSSPACATEHYPRTDPAVIMLIWSGDYCLLGRQRAWTPGMMSTLAGFVEPGETPEEAVAREVLEEAGVPVREVRYHSSQPWPFPGSLMIGFTAEAVGRPEPRIDPHELEAAAWLSRAEVRALPALPRPHSIARRLIEDWLSQ
jgi:NAD+ diphosphatase